MQQIDLNALFVSLNILTMINFPTRFLKVKKTVRIETHLSVPTQVTSQRIPFGSYEADCAARHFFSSSSSGPAKLGSLQHSTSGNPEEPSSEELYSPVWPLFLKCSIGMLSRRLLSVRIGKTKET